MKRKKRNVLFILFRDPILNRVRTIISFYQRVTGFVLLSKNAIILLEKRFNVAFFIKAWAYTVTKNGELNGIKF